MHASKWKVPVIFALNKIDLPDCHLELTRAELRRQCQLLHEHGLVDVDWTQEAEQAIPISALWKQNLEDDRTEPAELVGRIRQVTSKMPLPLRRPISLSSTPGEALGAGQGALQVQHLRKVDGGLFADAPKWPMDTSTAPVLPSRHRCLSRSIWSNTVGLYETYPEVSEAKSSFVDHRLKKFGPVKCFVTSPDPFSIHREETFKFGNKQIMRALRWKNVAKRTDFLQGVDGTPSAIALILEVDKAGEEQGEMVLTALVKAGRLVVGQFFVVGTSFGRITNLSLAAGVDRNRHWSKCETATVGVAVQLTGVRTRLGGDCAVDDLLFSLPRERAWRLCEHRQRIEQLMACQVAGPPLEVAWESDATIEARTQAAFERDEVTQPEAHSGTAYERRWQQAAVEEVSGLAATPTFDPVPRRDFARRVPLTGALESPETRPDPRASRL
eukprot:g8082.t1